MEFDELFDTERDRTNKRIRDLQEQCESLEQRVTKLVGEVKTYQFLITRIMVEQRASSDRISDLESTCASLALSRTRRQYGTAQE